MMTSQQIQYGGRSLYLSRKLSDLNEIRPADADCASKVGNLTTYQKIQIQNGGRPPY